MSGETLYDTRGRSLEDEYFHGRDREILERQATAARAEVERARLDAALGVPPDLPAIDVLLGAFVTPEGAEAVAWLPVIQLGWIEGMTPAEREAIKRITAAPEPLAPAAAGLIAYWCAQPPAAAVFEAGLSVQRHRLAALPADARQAARTRLLQACDAVTRADGGFLRVRAVSPAERAARHALMLALDAG